MPEKQPETLDPRNTVLFLGSGFSRGAINIADEPLPDSYTLRRQLAELKGVDPKYYTLRTLADAFRHDPHRLYSIIYDQFTVTTPLSHHIHTLSKPWLRIYTTNYDDLAELCLHSEYSDFHSFSYEDPKPNKIPRSAIIHLHGYIRKADENNVLHQLVLSEESYIRQHFERSAWYVDFENDLLNADACIFIGYSLNDYHITSLLLKNPEITNKTYFVCKSDYDQIFEETVSEYGYLVPVGAEGFPSLCAETPSTPRPENLHQLKSFRYIQARQDNRSLYPPTAIEVSDLFTLGKFHYNRAAATLPHPQYVIPRQKQLSNALDAIPHNKSLILHSRIGNGKSIFTYILCLTLSQKQYNCLVFNPRKRLDTRDINLLKEVPNLIIVFDHYNTAIENILPLNGEVPHAKFIVCVRSGIQDIRLHEIRQTVPHPFERIDLNVLTSADKAQVSELLNNSGLRTPDFDRITANSREMRDIVIQLYQNQEVEEKIRSALREPLSQRDFKDVFVAVHLIQWANQFVDEAFIKMVTGYDPRIALSYDHELSRDIFEFSEDAVAPRSSLLSEFALMNWLDSQHVAEMIYKIIVEAVRRRDQRQFQAILSDLMQFRNLSRLLGENADALARIRWLYGQLERDVEVNAEPLFWLQYSILMVAMSRSQEAERFLETAYNRAASRENFKTYQIDVHALRIYLMCEQETPVGSRVERFTKIAQRLQDIGPMLNEDSQRPYVLKVLEEVEPFVRSRVSDLERVEKTALTYHLSNIIHKLENFTMEDRVALGSDSVKFSLDRAKDLCLD